MKAIVGSLLLAISIPVCGRGAEPAASTNEIPVVKPIGWTHFGQIDNCAIDSVDATDEVVFVQFNGRWTSPPSLAGHPADTHGFSIERGKGMSDAAWASFVRPFVDSKGKTVSILICTRGPWVVRGGIPLLDFPDVNVQIGRNGEKPNFPIGFQF